MYYTHHFAHTETLSRARSWLTRLGFRPEQIEATADGVPRLSLAVDSFRLAEVGMVINAVESSDPDGWPSFWEVARQDHGHQARGPAEESHKGLPRTRTEVIGWHPVDPAAEAPRYLR